MASGVVAQLVERLICIQEAWGSTPHNSIFVHPTHEHDHMRLATKHHSSPLLLVLLLRGLGFHLALLVLSLVH
jgi:hypothetical protein